MLDTSVSQNQSLNQTHSAATAVTDEMVASRIIFSLAGQLAGISQMNYDDGFLLFDNACSFDFVNETYIQLRSDIGKPVNVRPLPRLLRTPHNQHRKALAIRLDRVYRIMDLAYQMAVSNDGLFDYFMQSVEPAHA